VKRIAHSEGDYDCREKVTDIIGRPEYIILLPFMLMVTKRARTLFMHIMLYNIMCMYVPYRRDMYILALKLTRKSPKRHSIVSRGVCARNRSDTTIVMCVIFYTHILLLCTPLATAAPPRLALTTSPRHVRAIYIAGEYEKPEAIYIPEQFCDPATAGGLCASSATDFIILKLRLLNAPA